ncbi:MAG: sodium-dependent transporter [Verrucomicrobiota bacterium]|nr:sodium-dependent transporter [Verrucomicrobiota bacterium]
MSENKRSVWGTNFGFLMATVGSAVGLGNIWRFSYMAYENGGGAFLVPYIVALLVAGIPLMILEYALGHKEKGAPPLAFARHHKGWEWVGWWMPTVATVGIILFYSVIIGWSLNYFCYSFTLKWGSDSQAFFFNEFLKISDSPLNFSVINLNILASTAIVWFILWFICYKEINHGIEKACMIFMPLLFVMTAVLVFWTITLDGAGEGIRHYLTPQWDKINIIKHYNDPKVWNVWISAFGQIFFTLSLGFGIMITYASYLPKKVDIVGNALLTSFLNCAYSIFAGFAVFGVLGFMAHTKGVGIEEVAKSGPSLAFVVYPEAISQLPFANKIFGALFFFTLVIAGFSSGISLIEAFTCSICDKFSFNRKKVVSIICICGFLFSLIFTTGAGLLILDIIDHFVCNYALVLGGTLECIFVGWVIGASLIRKYVNGFDERKLIGFWEICIKFITPLLLIVMLVKAAIADFTKPYEGYPIAALLLYGVGIFLITIILAIYLSIHKWDKEKLEHKPEDEHILT